MPEPKPDLLIALIQKGTARVDLFIKRDMTTKSPKINIEVAEFFVLVDGGILMITSLDVERIISDMDLEIITDYIDNNLPFISEVDLIGEATFDGKPASTETTADVITKGYKLAKLHKEPP